MHVNGSIDTVIACLSSVACMEYNLPNHSILFMQLYIEMCNLQEVVISLNRLHAIERFTVRL